MSASAASVPASSSLLLLGITHGGKVKEKLLKRQFENISRSKAFVVVLTWARIEAMHALWDWEGMQSEVREAKKNAVLICYTNAFIGALLAAYPRLSLGILCDANLGRVVMPQ